MNPAQLARRGSHVARALPQAHFVPARRASATGPLNAVPMRDGTLVRPLVLTRADKPKVQAFYDTLEPARLAEAHGSFCAMFSGVCGTSEESARSDMAWRFDAAQDDAHTAMGIDSPDGKGTLAAISFHRDCARGDARIYNLTVHQDFAGRGAAVGLVRAQLELARSAGYARMIVCVGAVSDEDWVGAQARSVVSIARMAAGLSGFPMRHDAAAGHVIIDLK